MSLKPSVQSTSTGNDVAAPSACAFGDLLDDQGALHAGVRDGDLGRVGADGHRSGGDPGQRPPRGDLRFGHRAGEPDRDRQRIGALPASPAASRSA